MLRSPLAPPLLFLFLLLHLSRAVWAAGAAAESPWSAGPAHPPEAAADAAAGAPKDKATWLDMRASELIGKRVASPQGKALGKVEDLILDTKGGYIPHVIVAAPGNKLFVFPVNAFARDEYRDRIVLPTERWRLAESTGFDASNWPFQPPLQRASQLRGQRVKDAQGNAVGKIEDVLVNLGSGKVRGVVVARQGRKADEPTLSLPLGSFSMPAQRGGEITLNQR